MKSQWNTAVHETIRSSLFAKGVLRMMVLKCIANDAREAPDQPRPLPKRACVVLWHSRATAPFNRKGSIAVQHARFRGDSGLVEQQEGSADILILRWRRLRGAKQPQSGPHTGRP